MLTFQLLLAWRLSWRYRDLAFTAKTYFALLAPILVLMYSDAALTPSGRTDDWSDYFKSIPVCFFVFLRDVLVRLVYFPVGIAESGQASGHSVCAVCRRRSDGATCGAVGRAGVDRSDIRAAGRGLSGKDVVSNDSTVADHPRFLTMSSQRPPSGPPG